MTITEKLKSLQIKKKEVDKIKREILKDSQEIFDDYCKEIFANNPRLESFSWTQYTPYFNDGSPCIFHANTDYIKVNSESIDESRWYHETTITSYGKWDFKEKKYVGRVEQQNADYDVEMSNTANQIIDFLSTFDDEFYCDRFGDHCEVVVTKMGISVDELDHD